MHQIGSGGLGQSYHRPSTHGRASQRCWTSLQGQYGSREVSIGPEDWGRPIGLGDVVWDRYQSGSIGEGTGKLPKALGKGLGPIGQNMRSDRVSMTKKHQTGLGLVVGLGNGQLDWILIGDSVQWFRDIAGGLGIHIWRSGRLGWGSGGVEDCSGESGLPPDTTRVCLGPLGWHEYDTITSSMFTLSQFWDILDGLFQ